MRSWNGSIAVAEQLCIWCGDRGCGVCGRFPSNVINIFERTPHFHDDLIPAETNEVISCLEDLLEAAHRGEFTGMCAVLDGPTETAVAVTSGALSDPFPYLGGINRISHRLNTEMDYDED